MGFSPPVLHYKTTPTECFYHSLLCHFSSSLQASSGQDDKYLKQRTALSLTVVLPATPFFFFFSGNHRNYVPTHWRLKKNVPAPRETPGSLAVEWQHLVCTWLQWQTSGVWWQEIESRWAAAGCFFYFFVVYPSSVSLYSWNMSRGTFWRGRCFTVVCIKALNGHTSLSRESEWKHRSSSIHIISL